MRTVDLHTHTTASDGSMKPQELVNYAREKGLSVIAVTDHDTIDGLDEAVKEGNNIGLKVIPGVEISLDFKKEMHMLGYFPNNNYRNIRNILDDLRFSRNRRNIKMAEKLNELGFKVSVEEAEMEASGRIVARPHFARVLLKKGYVSSISEAFEKYLGFGKPAYIEKEKLSVQDGILAILKAGGIPVLAHPKLLGLEDDEMEKLISDMAGWGMKGLEVYYVDNTEEETEKYLKIAEKYSLIPTGGSDFHGNFKPDIDLGSGYGNLKVPYEAVEALEQLAHSVKI